MEESTPSQCDLVQDTEPSPKPEDLSLSSSSIPLAQIPPTNPISWSTQIQNQKRNPRTMKATESMSMQNIFKITKSCQFPELVQAVEPKTLLFVVTDIKTRRLADLKKRNIRRNLKERRHPREIHLQKRFCNLECLAAQ